MTLLPREIGEGRVTGLSWDKLAASVVKSKRERNRPRHLTWWIARVFRYPRQESQSGSTFNINLKRQKIAFFKRVSFTLLREKSMLTWQILLSDGSNGGILRRKYELVLGPEVETIFRKNMFYSWHVMLAPSQATAIPSTCCFSI